VPSAWGLKSGEVLSFFSDHFQWDEATPIGELELVGNS
jgi:hypothetical protein